MIEEFTVGEHLTSTLARVRGLADGPIGSGHLLFAVANDKEVRSLLDAFDLSPLVVLTVLRNPGRSPAEPDAASLLDSDAEAGPLGDHPHVRDADNRSLALSAAAATALRSAPDSPVALLARLLDDPASEAFAVVRDCGVVPGEVRRSALDGRPPQRPEHLPAALRPARDALIGRTRYRGRGLRDRLLFSVLARQTNHAARPVLWIRLEAEERARDENRRPRTDDLLLAMLVTHQVAAAYPHMSRIARDNYGGGEMLSAEGVDHERLLAVPLDDRPDVVPPAEILAPGPDWTEDTRTLLDRLTAHPGNRATRLLEALRHA